MSELIPARGTLKTARSKVQTDISGNGTILLQVPGTAGSYSRLIKGGAGWFDTHHADDNVCLAITDEDNILRTPREDNGENDQKDQRIFPEERKQGKERHDKRRRPLQIHCGQVGKNII